MSKSTINRREFLRGASAVVGASMMGGAAAQILATTPKASVAYWDGERLISGAHLNAAGAPLERIQVTICSVGRPAMHRFDALFRVMKDKVVKFVPFHAWVRSGSQVARFTMPVDAQKGVSFASHQVGGAAQIHLGSAGTAHALREGRYIVAGEEVRWTSVRYDAASDAGPLVDAAGKAAKFGYLIIDVERV